MSPIACARTGGRGVAGTPGSPRQGMYRAVLARQTHCCVGDGPSRPAWPSSVRCAEPRLEGAALVDAFIWKSAASDLFLSIRDWTRSPSTARLVEEVTEAVSSDSRIEAGPQHTGRQSAGQYSPDARMRHDKVSAANLAAVGDRRQPLGALIKRCSVEMSSSLNI